MVDKNSNKIKLNLFENGLDFIQNSIQALKNNKNSSSLKYVTLHLASGVELIFKYRLSQEHWSLIFKDIKEAKSDSLETGKFKSVDFNDCLTRLENICDIHFPDKDKKNFENLRDKRNRMMHYDVNDSVPAMKASAMLVLNSIYNFIRNHLDEEMITSAEDIIESIWSDLLNLSDFVQRRMKTISSDLKEYRSYTAVVECPSCFQEALVIHSGENVKCLFCDYVGDAEETADEYVSEVLGISGYEIVTNGGEYPIYGCVECWREALVLTDDQWICFSCGLECEIGTIIFCDTCGTPYHKNKHDIGMCGSCISYRMRD